MMKPIATFLALAVATSTAAFAQYSTFCPGRVNSTGSSTILSGTWGSGLGSDLHLEVTGGVPGEFGYFLVSSTAGLGIPVSDGLLCLGGFGVSPVFRYNYPANGWMSIGQFDSTGRFQNLAGTSSVGTGFDVPATIPTGILIQGGDLWHFQLWYRDGGSQTGASNLSNGLSAFYLPEALQPIPGMVHIPAGDFTMGSQEAPGWPYYDAGIAKPAHLVKLSDWILMGQFEVTQADYQALMGFNPSAFDGPDMPVERVNWFDAMAYCQALTNRERTLGNLPSTYEYRLPTEAEWEYACRARTTSAFAFGAELQCEDAAFSYSHHSMSACSGAGPQPVGSFPPNAFGLHDMHGNVMEWVLDTYAGYSAGTVTDPLVTGGSQQVIRGGSWYSISNNCRSAYRWIQSPNVSSDVTGFRVVLAKVSP